MQVILLNKLQKLFHLIWLCLAIDILKIDQVRDMRVDIKVMTSANPVESKTKSCCEGNHC